MDWAILGIIFFLLVSAIYYPQLPLAVAVFRRFRRPKALTCPATGERTFVQIDASRAVWSSLVAGCPRLRVKGCSRWWNGEQDCKRDCLSRVV